MKINPKVTGALAWTGLVVVLAIPAANMLTGEPEARANLTSDTQQVKTASAAPVSKPASKPVVPSVEAKSAAPAAVVETAATSGNAVNDFVKSGKKMPSYISGNDAPVVDEAAATPAAPVKKPGTITINPDGTIQKPASSVPAVTASEPEVASVQPQIVAPVPLPASARPAPQTQTATGFPATTLPAPTEQPLIIDESTVASTGPVPPANVGPEPIISGDQLEEWDSGSLADYLERRGLMSDASQAAPVENYDADGFFLDEGPNNNGRRSRVIIY